MGLQEFNIAPDNYGGRPKQEEEDEIELRQVDGSPLTQEPRDDEWWLRVTNKATGHPYIQEDDMEQILVRVSKVADSVHASPIDVLLELKEHDLIDFNWADYREWLPEELHDDRIPGVNRFDGSGPLFGSTPTVDPDSGFASIISDAKRE